MSFNFHLKACRAFLNLIGRSYITSRHLPSHFLGLLISIRSIANVRNRVSPFLVIFTVVFPFLSVTYSISFRLFKLLTELRIWVLEYFLEPSNILNACTALPATPAPTTSIGREAIASTQRETVAIFASVVSDARKFFNCCV